MSDRFNRRMFARRAGASTLEVLVAFSLLSTVLAVATPLVIRHNRLLTAHRDYQLALDEVSNQLEHLSALPPDKLPEAIEKLTPSEFAAGHLRAAQLAGDLTDVDMGQRLTLRLTWDEPQRKVAPVTLAAWIFPRSNDAPEGTP